MDWQLAGTDDIFHTMELNAVDTTQEEAAARRVRAVKRWLCDRGVSASKADTFMSTAQCQSLSALALYLRFQLPPLDPQNWPAIGSEVSKLLGIRQRKLQAAMITRLRVKGTSSTSALSCAACTMRDICGKCKRFRHSKVHTLNTSQLFPAGAIEPNFVKAAQQPASTAGGASSQLTDISSLGATWHLPPLSDAVPASADENEDDEASAMFNPAKRQPQAWMYNALALDSTAAARTQHQHEQSHELSATRSDAAAQSGMKRFPETPADILATDSQLSPDSFAFDMPLPPVSGLSPTTVASHGKSDKHQAHTAEVQQAAQPGQVKVALPAYTKLLTQTRRTQQNEIQQSAQQPANLIVHPEGAATGAGTVTAPQRRHHSPYHAANVKLRKVCTGPL